MKGEVPTVRRAKCMRIYDDDNNYYFYILGIYLPCGAGKGSHETSNRRQDNGSVLNSRKCTGSTCWFTEEKEFRYYRDQLALS